MKKLALSLFHFLFISMMLTACMNPKTGGENVRTYNFSYDFSEPEIENNTKTNVYISHEKIGSSFTLVLFLHGSGCGTIEHIHPSSRRYLEDSGAAVMTIDKPGAFTGFKQIISMIHCSREYFIYNSPSSRANAVLSVLKKLKKESLAWNGELVIVSAHEGALAAALVSQRYPVKGIVILGTGDGFSRAKAFKDVSDCLKQGKLKCNKYQNSETMLAAAKKNETTKKINYRGISGHGKWWNEMLSNSLSEMLRDYTGKLLVLHAKKDTTIDVESAEKLVENLKNSAKSQVDFKVYEDLDGGFVDSNDKNQKHQVQLDIAKWVNDSLR